MSELSVSGVLSILDWSGSVLLFPFPLHTYEGVLHFNESRNKPLRVSLCVQHPPGGRRGGGGRELPGDVSRCHSTDPLKRLHHVQDSDFRPMLLHSIDLSYFVFFNKNLYEREHEAVTKAQNISAGQSVLKVLKRRIEAD